MERKGMSNNVHTVAKSDQATSSHLSLGLRDPAL